jgi:hypothetical protein
VTLTFEPWLSLGREGLAAGRSTTNTYMLGGDGGWDYIVPDPPNAQTKLPLAILTGTAPSDGSFAAAKCE